MTKLKVRMLPAPAVEGGVAAILCTDDGAPLPLQMETVLRQEAGGRSIITITFGIDGEHIEIEGSDA